jgi:hypothetical protein
MLSNQLIFYSCFPVLTLEELGNDQSSFCFLFLLFKALAVYQTSLFYSDYQNTYSARHPVAHAYNPSYFGGRDQEDLGLKPAPGK